MHLFYVLHIHSLSNLRSTSYIETRDLDIQHFFHDNMTYTEEQFATRLQTHLNTNNTEQELFLAMDESSSMISQLEEVLGQANVEYINEHSDDNEDQVQALKRAIGAHENYYQSLVKTLERKRRLAELQQYVIPQPPAQAAAQNQAQPHANHVQRIPTDLPTFRRSDKDNTTKDPTTFLRLFETTMSAARFPNLRWNEVLKSRVPTSAMKFVQQQIIDTGLDWDATKTVFKKHFLADQHAYLKGQQLDALRRSNKRHIDITTYNDHFEELVNDSGRDINSNEVADRYLDSLEFALGSQIRAAILAAGHVPRLEKCMARAKALERPRQRTPNDNRSNNNQSDGQANSANKFQCTKHGTNRSHDTKDCKALKREKEAKQSADVTCYKCNTVPEQTTDRSRK